ncbi:MAG: YDG domain-containing protein, partial [Prolixibacteraceae bacterium]
TYCQGRTNRLLTINPKPISITADTGQTKVYGSAEPTTFTYTWSPSLIGVDVIAGAIVRTAGKNAGDYSLKMGTLNAGTNYALSLGGTPAFTVTPKPITPVVTASGRCYDGTTSATITSQTLTGVISPDVVTLSVTSSTFDNASAGTEKTVTASGLSLGGADKANYSLTATASTTTAEIYALPVPVITGYATTCAGSGGNVYSTETDKTNYIWTVSAGGTITSGGGSTNNSVTVTWNSTGAQSVSVIYTGSHGCTAAAATVKNVTVVSLPVPALTGPATVCINHTNKVYTTDEGNANYIWIVSAGGTITSGGTSSDNSVTVTWNTAGEQSVSINYTVGSSCTAASPTVKRITVVPSPIPTLSGPESVCASTSGNVYTTESGMSAYTWIVSSGGTITSGGTATDRTATVTWNAAGDRSVSVNYQNSEGCQGATPAVQNVTVKPLPVPTITGASPVCGNMTSESYSTETGKSNYVWTLSSGGTITSGSGTAAITIEWSTAGTHTLTVNYTGTNGCSAATSTEKTIGVGPLPVVTLSGPATACVTHPGKVYSTESGKFSYSWIVSAGGTITSGGSSSDNTVTVTWNTAGAQTVSVNYQNEFGCSAVNPTVKNVTAIAAPVPTISGPASICSGASGNVYTTESGMSAYTWIVSSGGTITSGGTATDRTATVTWNAAGDRSVSVNYQNSEGCQGATPAVQNVTVKPLPVPTITGASPVCGNMTSESYSTETGKSNYVWTLSSGGTITSGSGTAAITIEWSTAGTHTLTVNYTGTNGCSAATSTEKTIGVGPLPVVTLSGPATACVTHPGKVYSTESGKFSYSWIVSAGGTITSGGSSSDNTVTVTWNTAGAQTVSVNYQNEFGCSAVNPTVKNVTAIAAPVPTISGPASICSGASGNVYTTESGMSAYTWIVSSGGTITSGGTATDRTATVTWNAAGDRSVSVNYQNSEGCQGATPAVQNVTVLQGSVGGSISGSATVCSGTNSTMLQLSGHTGNIVKWQKSLNNWITTTDIVNINTQLEATNLAATTKYRAVVQSGDCSTANSLDATVSITPASVGGIISGSANVCTGSNSTTLTLSGQSGTIVKWQKSTDGWVTSIDISNTTTTLTATNLTSSTKYRVVLQSGVCSKANSAEATVTVDGVSIGGTIAGSTAFCVGSNSTTLTLSGYSGSIVKWQKSTDNWATSTDVANTTTTLTATNLTSSTNYLVVVQSGVCSVANSDEAAVTIDPVSVGGIISGSATVCPGSNSTTLTLSGYKGSIVKWQKSVNNWVTTTDIANTASQLIASGLTETTLYRAVVRSGVCSTANSAEATLRVNPPGQVNQPLSQVVGNGSYSGTVVFGTVNTVGVTTYTWSSSNPGIGLASTGTGSISTFKAINPGTSPVSSTITVVPTYTNYGVGCAGPSSSFTITVNPTAQVNQMANQVICNGSVAATVNFATTNTGGTTTYAWSNSNTAIGLAAMGTGNLASFTTVNTGTAPVVATITVTPTYTSGGLSAVGSAKSFSITVNPTAQLIQPVNQVICNGSVAATVNFATTNTGGATTFAWSSSNTAIGLAAMGTGNIAAFTAVNTGTSPVVATITVTPTYTSGGLSAVGSAKTFAITVNPTPQVIQPVNQVLSNGSVAATVNFATANTGGTTTYGWSNSNTSIGLAASGTGNIAAFTAVNAGTAPVVATITVTPTYTSGGLSAVGSAKTFAITVNPTPQVIQPVNQVICNGSVAATVSFATANTGGTTTYTWSNSNTSIGLAASGTGNIAAFTAVNAGSAPVSTTLSVIPTYTSGGLSAVGPASTFTLTVNPSPAALAGSNKAICLNASTVLGTTAVTGSSYKWSSSPSGFSSTIANPTAGPLVTTKYTVVETITSTGCFNTNEVTITVNPLPAASAGADRTICAGTSTTLGTANVTGSNYVWTSTQSGSIPLISNPVVSPTSTTRYYLTQTVSSTGCTNSQSVQVSVSPTWQLAVSGSSTVCAGTKTVAYTTTPGMASYQWTLPTGAGIVSGAGTSAISVDFGSTATSGNIRVSGTTTCGTVLSESYAVTVNPIPPTPTFVVQAHTAISNTDLGNQWYLNGAAATTNGNDRQFTAANGGTVALLVSMKGCQSALTSSVVITTLLTNALELDIYPNPNQGQFELRLEFGKQAYFTIDIYNDHSQLLYKREKVYVDKLYVASIDLYGVSSGTYYVRAYNSDASQTIKVMVRK